MNLIDFIKQFTEDVLPRKHLLASTGLGLLLLLLLLLPDAQISSEQPSGTRLIDPIEFAALEHLLPQSTPRPQASERTSSNPASSIAATSPATPEQQRLVTEVRSGDNLSLMFDRVGLSPQDVYRVSVSDRDGSILRRLHPGYSLAFDIDDNGTLRELEIIRNPLESHVFTLNENNRFETRHVVREPERIPTFKEATIEDSLFLAAQRGGISASLTMEIANIFGGVIDFMLDTRAGDAFGVIYDERFLDGEHIGDGSIQAVQYINRGETFTALRYENSRGEVDYYNPQGESMRKAFLRNPVDFVRISSNFNPNRRHPILNTIRAHRGTDYAAPTGTPVVATADGRVTWAARNGSFGHLIVIQHGDRFETKYAHLSAYASGIRSGVRVRQGQVIGYVGATGGATGPHLHYEFLMDGVHRNPRTIHNQLPKAESIPAEEMERFLQQTQAILAQLDAFSSTESRTLAQNIPPVYPQE